MNQMLVSQKFQPVADLFLKFAEEAPAGGRALSIYQDGKLAVNLWHGEQKPGVAWGAETTSVIFSCTKGLVSILANRLIDEGQLDPEQRVAHYWPEFVQGGKGDIPVKWILQHKAGLSAVRRDLSFEELIDGHTVLDELAKQEPLWEPGTGHAYHALTFGHLVGKLIQSVTGKTVGTLFREVIAEPLKVPAWIGLPAAELHNLAPLITDGNRASANPEPGTAAYWQEKSMTFGNALPIGISGLDQGFNNLRLLATELAGAGGVMTANALAKIYSAAVTETEGVRLMTDRAIANSTVPAAVGASVWGEAGPWPRRGMGFMLDVPSYREWTSDKAFGHDGLGGQAGFGDPVHKIGFGFTTSYLYSGENEQAIQQALIRKTRECLNVL